MRGEWKVKIFIGRASSIYESPLKWFTLHHKGKNVSIFFSMTTSLFSIHNFLSNITSARCIILWCQQYSKFPLWNTVWSKVLLMHAGDGITQLVRQIIFLFSTFSFYIFKHDVELVICGNHWFLTNSELKLFNHSHREKIMHLVSN